MIELLKNVGNKLTIGFNSIFTKLFDVVGLNSENITIKIFILLISVGLLYIGVKIAKELLKWVLIFLSIFTIASIIVSII